MVEVYGITEYHLKNIQNTIKFLTKFYVMPI